MTRETRSLLDAVRTAVRRWDLLAPGDGVLVAVSGGADSVALLAALVELRAELAITLTAAHLDHGLRGAESAADRVFVAGLAGDLGVPLRSARVDLPPGNVEAEARRARYAFLERAADAVGASRIATAHTVEDQAETVLLRMLRGAGRRGLAGIRPCRGRVVRPLLLADRVQVRAFLAERGLRWRRDRSNFDYARARARVRLGFLPALARELNPRLARTLARLAEVLGEEDRLLDRLAARALGGRPAIDCGLLAVLDPPLARRAVRRWWRRHGSGRPLALAHVEAVRALAARAGGDGELGLPGGSVRREGGRLTFDAVGGAPPPVAPFACALAVGAVVETPGGWRVTLREDAPGAAVPGDDVCVLDADRVSAPLEVRSRRPGDRVRLHGLGGHASVKRLLIARRVPRRERDAHPLVVADGEVVWVPGCGRSDRALVTDATRRVLVVEAARAPRST